ncbi:hypothetical protein E2C01_057271 [Portunus trituberculatus]|uniref:Uncharacterized protein n=1 Tax=Portunus trituberculatus TaxID=210409 RepID=A0A5B7H1E4_PORTR|nr:hypothetical protein [Portunus trituberculatus]
MGYLSTPVVDSHRLWKHRALQANIGGLTWGEGTAKSPLRALPPTFLWASTSTLSIYSSNAVSP